MNLKKHTIIFNIIAPAYNLFYKGQLRSYYQMLERNEAALNLSNNSEILDIGCGTGAFGAAFTAKGHHVKGIDLAKNMVHQANSRGLNCLFGNILQGDLYPDNSFDLVICAYVAHGLDREKRKILFQESARISRGAVLFHDYSSKRYLIIDIIEFLEGGDYFNFIKTGLEEMKEVFSIVKILPVKSHNNWYLCLK